LSNGHAEHYPGPAHNPPVHTDPGYAGHSGSTPVHAPHHPKLQHHFDNMAQQVEASTLGMWLFLVTEIMFFGGLFMAYLLYRWSDPVAFQEASYKLDICSAASTRPCSS
jgi:heme/copper-type cytochrome/quinol oxidase subunit 3